MYNYFNVIYHRKLKKYNPKEEKKKKKNEISIMPQIHCEFSERAFRPD